jgi:hypothetical protein
MQGEAHREQRAGSSPPLGGPWCAAAGIVDRDLGAVLLGDLLHDRQAQAGAVDVGAQRAVEGPEDQLALRPAGCRGRCPRPAAPPPGRRGRASRAPSRCRRPACTAGRCPPGCAPARAAAPAAPQPRAGLVVGPLVAQVDALVHGLGHEVAHGFAHQFGQVHRLECAGLLRSSARAIASSWLTMCAARWLPWRSAAACASGFGSPWPRSISRSASSACMRRPASGVFSWCAASARKWRCALMDWSSRCSRSLMALTSGATSSGTSRSAMGLRSCSRGGGCAAAVRPAGGCRAPAPATPAAPPAAGSRTAAGSRP